MIQIHYTVFLFWALMILILPLNWITAVIIAALTHELMHILFLYFLGGRILKIDVKLHGCVIETSPLAEWKQFLSILAGPIGSFLLLLFSKLVPELAICGFFQGMYNMIPILPMDGGRMVTLLIHMICPECADRATNWLTLGFFIAVDLSVIWFSRSISFGFYLLLAAFLWNIKALAIKTPCKQEEIKVQ